MRPYPQAGERPHAAEKGAENEMGRIDEKHVPPSRLSRFQTRRPFVPQELRLLRYVFREAFLAPARREPTAQPQLLHEHPHLSRTATHACQLFDAVAGLGHRPWGSLANDSRNRRPPMANDPPTLHWLRSHRRSRAIPGHQTCDDSHRKQRFIA